MTMHAPGSIHSYFSTRMYIYELDRMNCDLCFLLYSYKYMYKIVYEIMLVNFAHISPRIVMLFLRELYQYSFFWVFFLYIYKCLCKILICSKCIVLLFYVSACFFVYQRLCSVDISIILFLGKRFNCLVSIIIVL